MKKLKIAFEQYKLGDKLQLAPEIFNDAIDIIKETLNFIKTSLK